MTLPPPPEGWISLAEFNFDGYTKPNSKRLLPPPSILFWDGKERKPRYWKDLLILTVQLLYTDGSLEIDLLPYSATRDKCIVHTDNRHPTGRTFKKTYYLVDAQIFVEADWGARDIVKHCGTLLVMSGKNPETDMQMKATKSRRKRK